MRDRHHTRPCECGRRLHQLQLLQHGLHRARQADHPFRRQPAGGARTAQLRLPHTWRRHRQPVGERAPHAVLPARHAARRAHAEDQQPEDLPRQAERERRVDRRPGMLHHRALRREREARGYRRAHRAAALRRRPGQPLRCQDDGQRTAADHRRHDRQRRSGSAHGTATSCGRPEASTSPRRATSGC